jgi:hypothetical protein
MLARAALAGEPCPGDEALARAIGSRSPGRAKRLLAYVETRGTIVCRMDYRGNRVVALPSLNCETAPGDPKAPAGDGKAPAGDGKTPAVAAAPEGKPAPPEMPGLFAAE